MILGFMKTNDWISVKDKLPDDFQCVYIKRKCGCPPVLIEYFNSTGFAKEVSVHSSDVCSQIDGLTFIRMSSFDEQNENVSHWCSYNEK